MIAFSLIRSSKMEKEEIIKIVEEEFVTLRNVQEAIIKDEKSKKVLLEQLDILKKSIIDKIK